ncbi:CGNR zinc finger domain-containing protein [Brevibacillus fluminis]|uniref:CGNR zinc finger domain-containing protein n=1 Tax=Brevibacillus fluminis TaxID=511487 RepID=UPI003F8BA052
MENTRYVLGGALWINLANTVNKRGVDLLDDDEKAEQWLLANDLLAKEKGGDGLQGIIAELRSLRAHCLEILADLERGEVDPKRTLQLQSIVENVQVRLSLSHAEDKLELICRGVTMTDEVRYQVVHSIIHTLQHVSRERIRSCEHEECILHFIDTSKSGKRRWCSMETCGNRQKAAEFYARKKLQK